MNTAGPWPVGSLLELAFNLGYPTNALKPKAVPLKFSSSDRSDRLIVVEYYQNEEAEELEDDTLKKVWVMLNPEIVKASEEKVMGVEGCLSVPNLVGEVERHAAIQVKGLNRRGQPMRVKAQGWLARIFQHEVDHLNGVVFTDRATRVWLPETEAEKEDRV